MRGLVDKRVLVAALGLAAVWPGAARAQTFTSTTPDQQYVVPPGAIGVRIMAVGGRGGGSSAQSSPTVASSGGLGAAISGDLTVTPGEILYVEVGGNGGDGGSVGAAIPGGPGGANGGGKGGDSNNGQYPSGGGGGGASDVRTCKTTAITCPAGSSLDSRLIVGAGGGGGGGGFQPLTASGGAGGQAGGAGSDGGQGTGGSPGTSSAGGQGNFGGGSGGQGIGGSGGSGNSQGTGGGGGGGLYGGAGGGAGQSMSITGGGGGGGSSYISPRATQVSGPTLDNNDPEVVITPIFPARPTCSATSATTPAGGGSVAVRLACSGPTGVAIHYAIVSKPSHGKLGPVAQSTARVTYTSTAGFTGSDSFTYRATDGGGSSQIATARITVPPVRPPSISGARLNPTSFRANSGTTLTLRLSEAATVRFTVTQTINGHQVQKAALSFLGKAGPNSFGVGLSGLRRGSYTAHIVAVHRGKASRPVLLNFRIT